MLRGCTWGGNAWPLPWLAGCLPAAPLGHHPGVTYSEGLSLKPTHPGGAWCPRVALAQNSALLSPMQRSPHEHKLFKDTELTAPSLTPGLRLQPSQAFPGYPSGAHPGDMKVDTLPLIREPRAQVSSVAGGGRLAEGGRNTRLGLKVCSQ